GGAPRLLRPGRALLLLALALLPVLAIGLALGRGMAGWEWAGPPEFSAMLPWRGPRLASAMAAGVLLGLAGAVLQRLSGNPMASPKVLGIGVGVDPHSWTVEGFGDQGTAGAVLACSFS
ncbi:iron chelate uptake ABC transporter family permease subunit, partial [Pseudoroseomonas ludipueritiae]